MKRTLLLAATFAVLAAAAWYAATQINTKSSNVSWDMDFAVRNTDDIGKIFIADRENRTATLERKDGTWLYNGKYPARQTAVNTLLETISRINVQYIPPEVSKNTMIRELAADGIKVEIYDRNNKPIKVYYVGGITADEKGTIMLMEGSEKPYVVHIPSFVGQVRVRYLLGDDNWRDRAIFAEKPEKITEISVEYPQRKSESFIMEKKEDLDYAVRPYFSTTPVSKLPQRKGVAEGYLLQFENLGAEAYETTNPFRDSVTALVPFVIVTVRREDGGTRQARFWPTAVQYEPATGKPFVHRYFAEVDKADFMLIQDRVFGPVFRGYSFFFTPNDGEIRR